MTSRAADFGQIPMSPVLAATLARASDAAAATQWAEVSLEHILAALCEDPDALAVLDASGVTIARLQAEAIRYVSSAPPTAPPGQGGLTVSADARRILEAAAAAARGGRRRDINGAIVLAAIVGDGRSIAAQILQAEGLTFDEAIKALQAALVAPAPREAVAAEDVLARARERVQSRATPTLRDIMSDLPRTAPPPPVPRTESASAPLAMPGSDVRPTLEDPQPAAETTAKPLPEGSSEAVEAPSQPQFDAPSDPISTSWPDATADTKRSDDVDPKPAQHRRPETPAQELPMSAPRSASPKNVAGAAPGDTVRQMFPEHVAAAPQTPFRQSEPGQGLPLPGVADRQRRLSTVMPPPIPMQRGQGGGPVPGSFAAAAPPMPYPAPPVLGRVPQVAATPNSNLRGGYAPPPSPMARGSSHAPSPTLAAPKRDAAGKVEAGQLAENIPRSMRVAKAARVEIRIAKASVKALTQGLDGGGLAVRHDVAVTQAMSVRLRAPEGGFFIETVSPETQWIESQLGFPSDDFASWRFLVTPQSRGWSRLQIIVSARTIGADGMAAETALPDQVVEVKVRTNFKRVVWRGMGWLVAAVAGGGLAKFGEAGIDLAQTYAQKFMH